METACWSVLTGPSCRLSPQLSYKRQADGWSERHTECAQVTSGRGVIGVGTSYSHRPVVVRGTHLRN